MPDLNLTPGMGDNIQTVDYASEESQRLRLEYADLEKSADEIEAEAKVFTKVFNAQSEAEGANLVKRLRDYAKITLSHHESEKVPHYRRGQAVDQYFFGIIDRFTKRSKTAKDGEADRINRLLTEYRARLLAEENERRRIANEEAERIAREAEKVRLEAERLAREAQLKAERARAEASKQATAEAAQRAREAEAAANVEAEIAAQKAEAARIDTLRKPADIMRTRTEDGTLITMGEEPFAEITDRIVLDLETLRPYFPLPALQQALNAYARSVGYSSDKSVQIKGAIFGKRAKSRVR